MPCDRNKGRPPAGALVLTSTFPRTPGSHEGRWILELAQQMAHRGIRPVVLAPHFPGGKLRESWGPVRVVRYPYFFPCRFERVAYGPGILANIRNDIFAVLGIVPFLISGLLAGLVLVVTTPVALVHSHWLVPQGFSGAVFRLVFGTPHVATVHGSDLALVTNRALLAPIGRFVIRHADIVTVNSTFTRQRLEAFVPDCRKKIRIIPMGIDPDRYAGSRSVPEDVPQEGPVILSVGRLIDWKGTRYLVDAMPQVLRAFPAARLIIAGTGPEEPALRRQVHEIGIDHAVFFSGIVDTRDLPSLYRSADVFVLPSVTRKGNTEALGVVLLEAMAAGCPVIGSDTGGISDIVADGENGFLVPEQRPDLLAERIVCIISDSTLRDRFQKNGLATVRDRFSWDRISDMFSEAYEEAAGNRSPGCGT